MFEKEIKHPPRDRKQRPPRSLRLDVQCFRAWICKEQHPHKKPHPTPSNPKQNPPPPWGPHTTLTDGLWLDGENLATVKGGGYGEVGDTQAGWKLSLGLFFRAVLSH